MPEAGFIAAFDVDPSSVQDKLSCRTFQPRSFVIIRRMRCQSPRHVAPTGPRFARRFY